MLDTQSVFRVDGIVAVITGGATGVGWMMAEALAVNGASKVFILGRREDVLAKAAAKYPEVMVPVACDISSKASLEAAAAQVATAAGFINLLVANSGVVGSMVMYDPSLSIPDLQAHLMALPMDVFTNTLHVNTTGQFFTMVAFLDLLDKGNKHALSGKAGAFGAPVKQGSKAPSIQSQVVFTSSHAGYARGAYAPPDYGSSKVAVNYLMKQASTCLAGYGIRANAMAPGMFPSEMTDGMLAGLDPEEVTPGYPHFQPTLKFGGEEEMAGAILYLASRAGSFTNGNVLLNDGGRASVITASY